MEVRPIGGLCNRLRVIGSRLRAARDAGKTLSVWWWSTADCPVAFRDLFCEPPADLIVYENTQAPKGIEVTCSTDPSIPVEAWAPTALMAFTPLPAIQERIDAIRARLGSEFVAVHIRRTDHNARYDEDAAYAAFAASYPGLSVYCAADNPRSIVTLKKALGDRLHYNGAFTKSGIRLTTIQDAVVDLWVSSTAQQFRGTYWSSFSDWIEMMRRLRGLPTGDCSKIAASE